MTYRQAIEIGPFHFGVMRLLIGIGLIRIYLRKETVVGGFGKVDRLMIAWAVWAVCSSFFHAPFSGALISRLGLVYNGLGIYWLMRVFIRDVDDVLRAIKMLLLILAPIAMEMLYERLTQNNLFSGLLGAGYGVEIRNGKARAQGPFGHSILAGTVGAVCLPLALLFWRKNRKLALAGMAVTVGMVFASLSSGPIMTMLTALAALCLWRVRHTMPLIRTATVIGVIGLSIVMNDPVYYLLARIDLTGSSTGWHRAALIESSINHLGEWWFAGTDYTRHWMPTGILANEQHTDITNYYIAMGVTGGLPLMFLFIWGLIGAFSAIGQSLGGNPTGLQEREYLLWTLGAVLFSHMITFLSVPYFDQTIVPFYFLLASIVSIHASQAITTPLPQHKTDSSAHHFGTAGCQN